MKKKERKKKKSAILTNHVYILSLCNACMRLSAWEGLQPGSEAGAGADVCSARACGDEKNHPSGRMSPLIQATKAPIVDADGDWQSGTKRRKYSLTGSRSPQSSVWKYESAFLSFTSRGLERAGASGWALYYEYSWRLRWGRCEGLRWYTACTFSIRFSNEDAGGPTHTHTHSYTESVHCKWRSCAKCPEISEIC